MKKTIILSCCIGLLTMLISGCGTTPKSRFYQLQMQNAEALNLSPVPKGERYSITMQPAKLASYLERPQLVVKKKDGSFSVMELHRWAGNLEEDVNFVLLADIASKAIPEGIEVKPWPDSNADIVIAVRIYRLDCLVDGGCEMSASWTIRKGSEKQSESYIQQFKTETDTQSGYIGMVRGMNQLLHSLADEIIKTLPEKA